MAFALALAMSGGTAYSQPDNVHAAVSQYAADHPGENVPVILRTTDSESAQETVTAFGGEVNADFGFISSVEAEVPASRLRFVAASNSVDYISLNAPIVFTSDFIDDDKVKSMYPFAVDADDAWDDDVYGYGVGVAVIDTGVTVSSDLMYGNSSRVTSVSMNTGTTTTTDGYGHGTHIAGIVGSDGSVAGQKYVGVAPKAHIINVKISNDLGVSSMGDLIKGLNFVYTHKDEYNIKVLNLSLHSSVPESYTTSPLDAAVEFLWRGGVFVVVASGNTGAGPGAMHYPPANDPFVMTVGATDDRGTKHTGDDRIASFSSGGVTQDGFNKPEIFAPGVNIVSGTSANTVLYGMGLPLGKVVTPGPYLKLSGTSMSAGVVSGVAALVFEERPSWTPGQMKCMLINKSRTATVSGTTFKTPRAEETYDSNGNCNADTGIQPSYGLLGTPIVPLIGVVASVLSQPDVYAAADEIDLDLVEANIVTTSPDDPTVALSMETVDWSAIKWDAIKWDLIKWDLIKWDLIKWDLIKWDLIKWDLIKWDLIKWDLIKWDLIKWDLIKWDLVKWDLIKWDLIKWDLIKWDAIKWDAIKWDSIGFDSATNAFEENPQDDDDSEDSSEEDSGDGNSDDPDSGGGSSDEGAAEETAAEEEISVAEELVDAGVPAVPEVPASPPTDTPNNPPTS
jgi:serine protease AprX